MMVSFSLSQSTRLAKLLIWIRFWITTAQEQCFSQSDWPVPCAKRSLNQNNQCINLGMDEAAAEGGQNALQAQHAGPARSLRYRPMSASRTLRRRLLMSLIQMMGARFMVRMSIRPHQSMMVKLLTRMHMGTSQPDGSLPGLKQASSIHESINQSINQSGSQYLNEAAADAALHELLQVGRPCLAQLVALLPALHLLHA